MTNLIFKSWIDSTHRPPLACTLLFLGCVILWQFSWQCCAIEKTRPINYLVDRTALGHWNLVFLTTASFCTSFHPTWVYFYFFSITDLIKMVMITYQFVNCMIWSSLLVFFVQLPLGNDLKIGVHRLRHIILNFVFPILLTNQDKSCLFVWFVACVFS